MTINFIWAEKCIDPNSERRKLVHLRRIYTTFILGTALRNFGTRANSFGQGPLDLHGKICFFNVDFWYGTPETRTAPLNLCVPTLTWQRLTFKARFWRPFAGCKKKKSFSTAKSNCMDRFGFERVKTSDTIERRNMVIPCTALTWHDVTCI